MLLADRMPEYGPETRRENPSGVAAAVMTATFAIAALGGAAIAGIQLLFGG